jgi:uncharacterized protein YkwD
MPGTHRLCLLAATGLAALALVGAAAAGTPLQQAALAPSAAAADSSGLVRQSALELAVLKQINVIRRSRHLAALRLNAQLGQAAEGHSVDMASHGFFTHEDRDGAAFWKRVKALYTPASSSYWAVGENLLWSAGQLGAAQAVQMWMDSPPHRENLLDPRWREVGLGGIEAAAAPGVYQGLDVTILTADFGIRR